MIIKKFQGKTEEDATKLAKLELGENAVIMHVKTVKKKGLAGLFKKPYVEVSAALEEESDMGYSKVKEAAEAITQVVSSREKNGTDNAKTSAGTSAPAKSQKFDARVTDDAVSDTKKTESESTSKQDSGEPASNIEEKLDSLHNLLEKQFKGAKPETEEAKADAKSNDFFKLIYNTLIDNEVDERFVNDIIDDAVKVYKPNSQIDYILANIYQRMVLKFGNVSLIKEADKKPKILFFIGPTGVGKTTTIAKLASKLSVDDKKKIVLLTTDTYRIAAAEQLRTYANILEVPFRVIYTPDELIDAIGGFPNADYIIVDTAGHSHNNESQKNGTKQFLESIDESKEKQVYLVLSATTKYRDLISVCETYSTFTKYSLIFTKLDETEALGNLYNIKLKTGADMSYITCGQDVPDDIEEFSPQNTVKQLLGGKT